MRALARRLEPSFSSSEARLPKGDKSKAAPPEISSLAAQTLNALHTALTSGNVHLLVTLVQVPLAMPTKSLDPFRTPLTLRKSSLAKPSTLNALSHRTLNHQASTQDPKPQTPNPLNLKPQPQALNPKLSQTLHPKPYTLNPNPTP